jgi:hypothetical protein
MGLIPRFTIFFFFIFLAFSANSQSIYEIAMPQISKEVLGLVSSSCGVQMDALGCATQKSNDAKQALIDANSSVITNSSFSTEFTRNYSRRRYEFVLSYNRKTLWSPNGPVKSDLIYTVYGYAQFSEVTIETCPPDDHPQNIVPWDNEGTQSVTCFDPIDLNFVDSCPDSTQDGSYVLPVTASNSSTPMCQTKPDGSQCKYDKVDDVFVTNFENDCYSRPDYDDFDETGLNQPDPLIRECQLLGQGVSACIENPENVCDSNGTCNTGCGSVSIGDSDPTFICLSEDTDQDGLADYADPDIDGDGIANEVDLDSDGDGLDDPKYPRPDEPMNVTIDTGNLETLAAEGNDTLQSIKEELETRNGSGQMPDFSPNQDANVVETSFIYRVQNSDLLLAFSSMSNFINFGSGAICPDFSFALPDPINQTVGTTIHCDLMPIIGTVVTPVMYALYLWAGFRIFASA